MSEGVGRTPAPSTAESVAALAGQLERLETKVARYDIGGLRADVRGITTTVAGLAEELAQFVESAEKDEVMPSWLWPAEPMDAGAAAAILAQVIRWSRRVYIRYGDGVLPECWLWHPEVVEELLWLCHSWLAAYRGPMASAQRAADWHDRQRPGVARRIRAAAGSCSLREHFEPPMPPVVPTVDAAGDIAAWWVDPARTAPVPTGEQVRAADAALRPRGGVLR